MQQAEIAKAQGKEEVKVKSDTLFLFFFPRWVLGKLEYTTAVPSKSSSPTDELRQTPERGLYGNKYQKQKDVTKQVNINIQCFPVYCISFCPPFALLPFWDKELSSRKEETSSCFVALGHIGKSENV